VQQHTTTVILPVVNETYSLRQTVEMIEELCSAEVFDYLIVICKKTSIESRKVIEEIVNKYGHKVRVHDQVLPFLGGAMRECFDLAKGTHLIMMASDLETNPEQVPQLIALSKQHPDWIVGTNRWTKGGGFTGYSPVKLVFNFFFQKFFSILYRTNLKDMTYGYRIFPTALVQSINWTELKHPFLFESICKPLRLGVKAVEIPSVWKARTEGESQNPFINNFKYFGTGIKIRFMSKSKIKK